MEKMYSVKEVADLMNVAQVTVRLWIQKNKIGSVKINGSRRISETEILRLQKGE